MDLGVIRLLAYFAPTSRFGGPRDFMALIDTLHQRGIGVVIDWAPAHFPDDPHGLARFDGTHLYEHMDPRMGRHPHWDTLVFNYGRAEVANFLVASAVFWCEKYHVDGIRVDAVASMLYRDYGRQDGEWIPNRSGGNENFEAIRFLQTFNEQVYGHFPDVMNDGRGIHGVAPGHAPYVTWWARLRLQVEHGLDARYARLHEVRSHLSQAPSQSPHLQHALRVSGELPTPLLGTTKWCTARRLCWRRCPARRGRNSPT